eukprot:TRINITY_DN8687_c0_g1_i1.p3 TRINITY_DN8687_c0_g1~~TRINITY_DN8687_c0_g1_i1.p3  ORF type:complete len:241 (-),score=91.73 TRINITY_DN8687_c0_g1_i1:235-957(-)
MPISAQQLIEQATVQPQLVAALEAMSPQAAAAVRRRDVPAVQGFLDLLSQSMGMGWGGVSVGGGPPVAGGGGGGGGAAAAGAVVDVRERERLEDVAANFEAAIEHVPESFAPVVMLYVRAAVAGVPVTAFVDSGAQATILSRSTAERCGVGRLLDTRFSGVARGVGTAKILGKVHLGAADAGGGWGGEPRRRRRWRWRRRRQRQRHGRHPRLPVVWGRLCLPAPVGGARRLLYGDGGRLV